MSGIVFVGIGNGPSRVLETFDCFISRAGPEPQLGSDDQPPPTPHPMAEQGPFTTISYCNMYQSVSDCTIPYLVFCCAMYGRAHARASALNNIIVQCT